MGKKRTLQDVATELGMVTIHIAPTQKEDAWTFIATKRTPAPIGFDGHTIVCAREVVEVIKEQIYSEGD